MTFPSAGPNFGEQSLLVWSHLTVGNNILCSKNILIFKVCNVIKRVGNDFYEVLAHFPEGEAEAHRLGRTPKARQIRKHTQKPHL